MPLSPEAQAIVDEESRILDEVLHSLEAQRWHSERKLGIESARSRELTSSLVNMRRAEDKALLASDEAVSHALKDMKIEDLKHLATLLKRPYFGRIVIDEAREGETKTIEYRIGLAANPDCRIIDWRSAPISKLYYEYKQGDEYDEEIQGVERRGRIVLRRTIEIENGELRSISSPLGTVVRDGDEWVERSAGGRRPGGARTLSDIVPLITPDQFRMITEDADTTVLIQGVAGSGKTTVALHRLAWLLSAENSDLGPNETMVVVQSMPLKRYIGGVLPALGVNGVRILTVGEWAGAVAKSAAPHLASVEGAMRRCAERPSRGVERVKRSLAALQALEEYSAEFNSRWYADARGNLPWEMLPSGISKILDEAQKNGAPAGTASELLKQALTKALDTLPPTHERYQGLYLARSMLSDLAVRIEKPEDLIEAALGRVDAVLRFDESKLLTRAGIEEALARTRENRAEATLDQCDDGLFLRAVQLLRGPAASSLNTGAPLRHLVFDEVQDSCPAELAAAVSSVKSISQLTLVGDINQQIEEERTFPGWDKLRERWKLKDSISRFVSLTVSHRSSFPIMKLGDHVQGTKTVTGGRQGRVPIWFKARSEERGFTAAIGWLRKAVEMYPSEMTAVICADRLEAKQVLSLLEPTFGSAVRLGDEHSFSFDEGIVVSDVRLVKGLEFCNVLIWNPGKRAYSDDPISRNRLYVAMTRAVDNLAVATWGNAPLTPLLPHSGSQLMRVVDLVALEEDDEREQKEYEAQT